MSRIVYVGQNTEFFVRSVLDTITVEELERFAAGAEETAHEKSRAMSEHLKDDETALTNHAACMRTTAAKIVQLRGGLVPALKIDPNNPAIRIEAVRAMGWIRADFEAMDCLFR